MADTTGGFAQLSLFLTLAFGLPGIVFIGFAFLYFPDVVNTWIQQTNLAYGGTLFAALVGAMVLFFVGLVVTSILFFMEYLLRRIPGVERHLLPKLNFGSFSALQYGGKDISYLMQQAGQAVMHYNIWSGVGVITIGYAVRTYLDKTPLSWLKLVFGIAVVAANMFAAQKLFGWARDGMSVIQQASGGDKPSPVPSQDLLPHLGARRTLVVGVDVDSVLAELISPLVSRLRSQGIGLNFSRSDLTDWNIKIDGRDIGSEIAKALADPEFTLGLPPIDGATGGMEKLGQVHRVIVVSSRSGELQKTTKAWLDQHFKYHAFVTTNMEGKAGLGLDVLVDDNLDTAIAAASAGTFAILFTQPWNLTPGERLTGLMRAGLLVRSSGWEETLAAIDLRAQRGAP